MRKPRFWAFVVQVAQRYASTVAPFLKSCPQTADILPPGDVGTQALYLWATAMISSYSFTIGDDRSGFNPAMRIIRVHHALPLSDIAVQLSPALQVCSASPYTHIG